jgi:hypothetical protein
VSQQLSPRTRAGQPYFARADHPGSFEEDWNRSYTLEPMDRRSGPAVLLHVLTDSPNSLPSAERYRANATQ